MWSWPFPQCFDFKSDNDKKKAAEKKKLQFLDQAVDYINLLQPAAFIPFAGTYILGSRLADLNDSRGIPKICDAISYIATKTTNGCKGVNLEQFDIYNVKTKALKNRKTQVFRWMIIK